MISDLPSRETIRRFATVHYEVPGVRERKRPAPSGKDDWRFEGELRLKEFLQREVARLGITDDGVMRRIQRGKYAGLVRRSEGSRVVWVRVGNTQVPNAKIPKYPSTQTQELLTSDL